MIPRPTLVVLAMIVSLACATPAWAQAGTAEACDASIETVVQPYPEAMPVDGYYGNDFIARFVHSVIRDTKRNNCWPEPFVGPTRAAVRAPFVAMVSRGWERQNTLGDQNFEPESGKLNLSGQIKVRKILLEGLPEHRTVFVHRSINPDLTTARLDAVQQLAVQLLPEGELPQVLETNRPPIGWSAQTIDEVDSKFRSSMPVPRLPKPQGEGESTQ